MTGQNGGGSSAENERLAPVIPLFGARTAGTSPRSERTSAGGRASSGRVGETGAAAPSLVTGAAEWRSTWADAPRRDDDRGPGPRHPAYGAGRGGVPIEERRARAEAALRAVGPHSGSIAGGSALSGAGEQESEAQVAAEALVRKLRGKQLSSSEARSVLREAGASAESRDAVIADFEARGYLDDRSLADHLVTSGSQRRGQGRVAIARILAQRGIPRDIADAALEVLDDDDDERALEYARGKAASLVRYDEETALRRLVGQLSRRGYQGGVAMNAARTALREARFGNGVRPGRVRFEESD